MQTSQILKITTPANENQADFLPTTQAIQTQRRLRRRVVLNFGHFDFEIVSDFDFRISDFHYRRATSHERRTIEPPISPKLTKC